MAHLRGTNANMRKRCPNQGISSSMLLAKSSFKYGDTRNQWKFEYYCLTTEQPFSFVEDPYFDHYMQTSLQAQFKLFCKEQISRNCKSCTKRKGQHWCIYCRQVILEFLWLRIHGLALQIKYTVLSLAIGSMARENYLLNWSVVLYPICPTGSDGKANVVVRRDD